MARSSFAITLLVVTLVAPAIPAAADVAGTITAFKMSDVDVYSGAGEFLCVVDANAFSKAASSDICTHAVGDQPSPDPVAASIPVKEVADDGQLVVEWGGKDYRIDPFQVDASMKQSDQVKTRCPKLAGRMEMAATRGLGENDCNTE